MPTNQQPREMRSARVMVPLDGSLLAEAALAPAASLSFALSAPLAGALHLTRVIHSSVKYDTQHYDQIASIETLDVSAATAYLSAVQQRVQDTAGVEGKLAITSSVIVDHDIAGSLIALAESGEGMETVAGFQGCDVIAIATHERGGLERLVLGSTTERVLSATRLPLLIIRPQRTEEKHGKADVTNTRENGKNQDVEIPSWVGLF